MDSFPKPGAESCLKKNHEYKSIIIPLNDRLPGHPENFKIKLYIIFKKD